MSADTLDLRQRAAEMRASFDGAFAVAATPAQVKLFDLISVRVAGETYALHTSGIAAVHAELRVTKLPSSCSELLGVVSMRASFAPVYDLAALLGHAPARPESLRWFMLSAGTPAVVLAFEGYGGYLRVTDEALTPVAGHALPHVRQQVEHHASSLPVIDLASLLAAVTALAEQGSER